MEDLELEQMHGQAVARLMGDPSVRQVFAGLDAQYYAQWKASTSVEARERIHAKASALSDLENELQAVIDAGAIATRKLER